MAAVTICSNFGAPKNSLSFFPLFPHLFAVKWWDQMPWSLFSECWALSQLFHSPLSLSSRGLFSSSSLSAIRVVSSAYLRLLIFLPAILIPACVSFSPAFLMMYSAYKLNKQGDNIHPWCTPFPVWNQFFKKRISFFKKYLSTKQFIMYLATKFLLNSKQGRFYRIYAVLKLEINIEWRPHQKLKVFKS